MKRAAKERHEVMEAKRKAEAERRAEAEAWLRTSGRFSNGLPRPARETMREARLEGVDRTALLSLATTPASVSSAEAELGRRTPRPRLRTFPDPQHPRCSSHVGRSASVSARLYMGRDLMTTELADRGVDVHQEFEVDLLKRFKVADVTTTVESISPAMTVGGLIRQLTAGQAETAGSPRDARPIVDAEGRLLGVITYGDIVRAVADGGQNRTVLDAGSTGLQVAYEDERLWEAMVRMAQYDVEQLPVVSRPDPTRLTGWLEGQGATKAALGRVDRERMPEKGWFRRLLDPRSG